MSSLSRRIDDALGERERHGLLRDRHRRPVEGPSGPRITINGQTQINFASNGYLGLSLHPKVIQAFEDELRISGTSSAASRLVTGNTTAIQSLEKALAAFKGTEDALLMSNGYQANVGVLQSVGTLYKKINEPLVIFSDSLNHASLVDGCSQARAEVIVYPHRDVRFLRKAMIAHEDQAKFIVTESRFSMDGDIAPLAELVDLKNEFDAGLFVDEAHATGIDGEGRGLIHKLGLTKDVDFIVGTLGKGLGTHGAYVAGDTHQLKWLANTARTFIYSTALPAAVARATLAALDVLKEERPYEKLNDNIRYFRERLTAHGLSFLLAPDADGPILPIIVGSPERALKLQNYLETKGILAVAIRPPTVPAGTSRIRLSLRADHDYSDIDLLIDALREVSHDD